MRVYGIYFLYAYNGELNLLLFNLFIFQLAQLSSDDMIAVNNMRYLGGSDTKKASGSGFSLKFDISKVTACAPKFMIIDLSLRVISGNNFFQSIFCQKKHAARKERNSEETWQLSRFYPLIEVNFIMLEHIKFIFLYFYGLSWLFSLVSSLFFPCLLPYDLLAERK